MSSEEKKLFAIGFIGVIAQIFLEWLQTARILRQSIPYNYVDSVVQLGPLISWILIIYIIIERYELTIPNNTNLYVFLRQSFIIIGLGYLIGEVINAIVEELTIPTVRLTLEYEIVKIFQTLFVGIIITAIFIGLLIVKQYNTVAPKYFKDDQNIH